VYVSTVGASNVTQPQTKAESEWGLPVIEVDPKLAAILSVTRCQWISGMSCRITYNGKNVLPSEVFFVEFDSSGKQVGNKVRLIYPELKPGHFGVATFGLRSKHPARIVLSGIWEGPWKNPY